MYAYFFIYFHSFDVVSEKNSVKATRSLLAMPVGKKQLSGFGYHNNFTNGLRLSEYPRAADTQPPVHPDTCLPRAIVLSAFGSSAAQTSI